MYTRLFCTDSVEFGNSFYEKRYLFANIKRPEFCSLGFKPYRIVFKPCLKMYEVWKIRNLFQ